MKFMLRLFFLIFFMVNTAWAQAWHENLLITSSKSTLFSEEKEFNRSVYFIEIPAGYKDKLYFRVFDADLGGAYDKRIADSQTLYRIYGKGSIVWDLPDGSEPFPDANPIFSLKLGESKYHDAMWRTLFILDPAKGEPDNDYIYFQIVIEGINGRASNKYQLFVSSENKKNIPVKNLSIFTPMLNIQVPGDPVRVTQIKFNIPKDARAIEIFNFDADVKQKKSQLFFESEYRLNIPVKSSADKKTTKTRIEINPDEQGKTGGIIIKSLKVNYIQLWILDDKGDTVPLELPFLFKIKNKLPEPKINTTILSDCVTMLLDASASFDPDGDDLFFEWKFQDGTTAKGSRITHDFKKSGEHSVWLKVADNSGFVANTQKVLCKIHINSLPVPVISAKKKGYPGEPIEFDGSKSYDADGKLTNCLWNFGDGTKDKGCKVKHKFGTPGRYKVILTVEDNGEVPCNKAKSSHLIFINSPPVANIEMKTIAGVDEPVTMDGSMSVDSDGEIISYEWNFGDGEKQQGKKVIHKWKNPGRYNVTLKIHDDTGLKNSVSMEKRQIIINARPVAVIDAKPLGAVLEEIRFDGGKSHDPDGNILKYEWRFSDGTTKNGKKIFHSFKEAGIYEVTLIVTDNSQTTNNSDSISHKIKINTPPVAHIDVEKVVNKSEVFFDGSGSMDADGKITDYLWDFGDGNRAHGEKVTHIYKLPGTYEINLKVKDDSCTISELSSASVKIRVNHTPVADAGGKRVAGAGETIDFDGTMSVDPDGTIVSYEWEIDGKITPGKKVSHKFDRPGIYQAKLIVKDNDGAQDIDYADVIINGAPVPCVYPLERLAPGKPAIFDGSCSYDPDGKIENIMWDFGDGTFAKGNLIVSHKFKQPGDYTVILTLKDDSKASNNMALKKFHVRVNHKPVANAGKDIYTCSQSVMFNGLKSYDAENDTLIFSWDFGDGKKGQGPVVSHHYENPGIYPVTLSVDDGKGLFNSVAKDHLNLFINAPPVAVLNVNKKRVCAGETVLFDASRSSDPEKGSVRYVWNLGHNDVKIGVNPTKVFKDEGPHKIKLTVFDDSNLPCNFSEDEILILVISAPVADAGEDLTVCANQKVKFDGTNSKSGGRPIKSYEWNFGDGSLGAGPRPVHVYRKAGTYKARLKITVEGKGQCENVSEDTVNITVMESPHVVINMPLEGCPGQALDFSFETSKPDKDKIFTSTWFFGDGKSASGKKCVHTYKSSGEYEVKLEVSDKNTKTKCNTTFITKKIKINEAPVPVILVSLEDKDPKSYDEYKTKIFNRLRFEASLCKDPDGYIESYEWDFGDGHTQKGPFATHLWKKPGEYIVTLHVKDNNNTPCSRVKKTMKVIVENIEKILPAGPEKICAGHNTTLSVPFDNNDTKWFFNDGRTAKGSKISKNFDTKGLYQVLAKAKNRITMTKNIVAYDLPQIILPEKTECFLKDKVKIKPVLNKKDAQSFIFTWDMGDGTILKKKIAEYVYKKPGTYEAKLIIGLPDAPSECLKKEYKTSVRVLPLPQASILVSPEILHAGGARDEVTFQARVQGARKGWIFNWDFGDGEKAKGKIVKHKYMKPGKFTVKLQLSDGFKRTGRIFTFSKKINIVKRPSE